MDTLHYALNVTHWPLSPLLHREEAQAYDSQDGAEAHYSKSGEPAIPSEPEGYQNVS